RTLSRYSWRSLLDRIIGRILAWSWRACPRVRRLADSFVPADRDAVFGLGRDRLPDRVVLFPGGDRFSGPPRYFRRGGNRNSRRRKCDAADQSHTETRIPCAAIDGRGGVHAKRELVELPAPQTRRSRSTGRSGSRRSLLLQN